MLGSSGLPYVIDQFEVAGQLSDTQYQTRGLEGGWSKDLLAHPSDTENWSFR